jgi:flagellin FlaB
MRDLFRMLDKDVGAIGIGAMIVLIAMILVAGVAASVLITTSNTLQSQAMTTGSQTTREVSSGLKVFQVLGYVPDTGEDIERLAVTVSAKPGSDKIDLSNTYVLISDGTNKTLLSYAGTSNTSFYNDSVTGNIFAAMTWEGDNYTSEVESGDDLNSGNASNWTWSNDQFGIGVLQDYDGSMTRASPVLTRGDKAILYFRCDSADSHRIFGNGSYNTDWNSTNVTGWNNFSGVFGNQIGERIDIFGRVIPEIGAPGVISFTSPKAYVDKIYTLQ